MKLGVAHFLFSLILGTLTAVGTRMPAQAGEKIKFIAGPLRFSLRISSLKIIVPIFNLPMPTISVKGKNLRIF